MHKWVLSVRWCFILMGHLLFFSTLGVQAKTLDVSQVSTKLTLTEYFDVLEDPSQKLTLQDVVKDEAGRRFKGDHEPAPSLSYGYTKSAYWLRLQLSNSSSQPVQRMLQIESWGISYLDWYYPGKDGTYQTTQTGSALDFASRPYPSRYFVFPVTVEAHATVQVYLRAQSVPLNIPAILWEPQAFSVHERNTYIAQSLYYGLAAGMAVFNLLIFIALRDRSYLLYVLYVVCMTLAFAENTGWAKEFFWQSSPWWTQIASTTLYSWTFAAALFFQRNLLGLKELLPVMDKPFRYLAYFYIATPVMYAVAYEDLAYVSLFLNVLTLLLILGVCVWGVYRRQRSAFFFLIAFSWVLIGGIAQILRYMSIAPMHWTTEYGLQMGSAIQMLLLAFALGDRFNQIRKHNARVRSEALLTKTKQVQSERLAQMGQIMSGMADGINAPLELIRTSGMGIPQALDHALTNLPVVFKVLDEPTTELFVRLVHRANEVRKPLSHTEAQALADKACKQLERVGIVNAPRQAAIMVSLNAHTVMANYLPLLRHAKSEVILETAASMADIINSSGCIQSATDTMGQISSALKAFSGTHASEKPVPDNVSETIELVLGIFNSSIGQGIELVKRFQSIPLLPCFPDGLSQLWAALIQFSIHNMEGKGVLTISIRRVDKNAVISMHNTGSPLPEDLHRDLLNVLQTDTPAVDMVDIDHELIKKIMERHGGRIDIQNELTQGFTLQVYLPYP